MFYACPASSISPHTLSGFAMKKLHTMLKKCKSLSRQLRRSCSYTGTCPRLESGREEIPTDPAEEEHREMVYVGSKRRQYAVSSRHLKHPLLNSLIEEKSKQGGGGVISVKCEVVLFDHLLWMLDNADPNLSSESLEELTELYSLEHAQTG